jgi:transposase
MSLAPLLPAVPGMLVEQVVLGEEAVTIVARLTTVTASCPCCAQPSTRVHSYARRTLIDLPASGRQMRLSLQIRRFRCLRPTCPRRTFREQIPTLALPRVHRTKRLQETLGVIGFALGGEAGARLAKRLGMACSPDTLLRLVQQQSLPAFRTPRVLGVDDFSFLRGRIFGTILLDLERRVPIDLLPDREAATFAAWLIVHPGVEIISRDRGGTYAEGARLGAPQAKQTADRWHLLKNLGEALEGLFLHQKQALRDAVPRLRDSPADHSPPAPWLTGRTVQAEAARLRRQARLVERFHQIHECFAKGVDRETIAGELGINRKTVYRYLKMDQPPDGPAPQDRRSLPLDRYKPYLLQRWNEGCRNAKQLWGEVRARGYTQSRSTVGRFVGSLRHETGRPHKFKQAEAAALYAPEDVRNRPLTAVQAARLFTSKEPQRTTWQQTTLTRLCATDASLAQTYAQVQAFCEMVRQCQGDRLDQWLAEVEAGGVQELRSFAKGLQKDYEAVKNGLTLPWSQGPTEGHILRLKLLKRQMYGRASFPLLRQRVLSRS